MRAVAPLRARLIDQLEVGLVDELRRRERGLVPRRNVPVRDLAQFPVNEGNRRSSPAGPPVRRSSSTSGLSVMTLETSRRSPAKFFICERGGAGLATSPFARLGQKMARRRPRRNSRGRWRNFGAPSNGRGRSTRYHRRNIVVANLPRAYWMRDYWFPVTRSSCAENFYRSARYRLAGHRDQTFFASWPDRAIVALLFERCGFSRSCPARSISW